MLTGGVDGAAARKRVVRPQGPDGTRVLGKANPSRPLAPASPVAGAALAGSPGQATASSPRRERSPRPHSHSIVAGGLLLMS